MKGFYISTIYKYNLKQKPFQMYSCTKFKAKPFSWEDITGE